jgi:DNA-binding beta-propeller fold protein YncE
MRLVLPEVKASSHRALLATLLALVVLLFVADRAGAERKLIAGEAVSAKAAPGGIEGACGIAFGPSQIYVSDYYHHAIDVFGSNGAYESQLPFGSNSGPCQLASSPSGALYANDWHEGVSRALPSLLQFDSNESTGVAVDQVTGNVYVNDRSYVAAYEPSGAPVLSEGQPLKIGLGSLGDGYGLALFAGKLYVPDAADSTVKVYEPAIDTINPMLTIDGSATPQKGFNSLVDAAVAVDPTNAHLLVLDNLQPGFEHPEAALDEFDSAGKFLGQLSKKVIDGGPSGLAFSGANLYATSGNSEGSSVLKFGAYTAGGGAGLAAEEATPPAPPSPEPAQAASAPLAKGKSSRPSFNPLSQAVVIQRAGIKVSLEGKLAPRKLPRHGSAPVRVAVGAKIAGAEGKDPPQLRTISIAINRYGHFDPSGLPICTERDIQPATNQNALKACGSSLVGVGSFSARVGLSQQAPFPSEGKMYAFNGRVHGRPAILAHVYGTNPVPTSFTFPFELRPTKGTYGTILKARLPQATGNSGYITGLSMNLGRNFSYRGKRHSYLTASCPAPKGFSKAVFPLAHAGFFFKGGRSLGSTLVRSCGVRG